MSQTIGPTSNPIPIAAVHGDRSLTYGELDARANRVARALLEHELTERTLSEDDRQKVRSLYGSQLKLGRIDLGSSTPKAVPARAKGRCEMSARRRISGGCRPAGGEGVNTRRFPLRDRCREAAFEA